MIRRNRRLRYLVPRFRRKVIPGDNLYYKVVKEKQKGPFYWFAGTATVDNEIVASVKFSAYMK